MTQSIDLSKSDKADRERRREILSLLLQLRANNTKSVKAKVVKMLSEEPDTRDSDMHLTIRIFERFYPQYIKNGAIALSDLFNVPKQYDIQRFRAHIQNTLGLYQASLPVRELRLKQQKKHQAHFSQEANKSRTKTLSIYCDESGKADKFSVVAAFCTVQIEGEPTFNLEDIKSDMGIDSEVKFHQVKPQNRERFRDFFQLVLAQSEPWSARALYLENTKAARRTQDDRIWEMLQFLATDVIAREIESHRLKPPFKVRLIKDADPSQDAIRLKRYEERLQAAMIRVEETKGVEVETVRAEESKSSAALQAADLVAGSFSRHLNGGSGESPKFELAGEILQLLGYPTKDSGKDHVSLVDFVDAKLHPSALADKINSGLP